MYLCSVHVSTNSFHALNPLNLFACWDLTYCSYGVMRSMNPTLPQFLFIVCAYSKSALSYLIFFYQSYYFLFRFFIFLSLLKIIAFSSELFLLMFCSHERVYSQVLNVFSCEAIKWQYESKIILCCFACEMHSWDMLYCK